MPTPTSFGKLVEGLINLINLIIPLIFSVVFLVLVWKIFDAWVINSGDEKKREEGKQFAFTAVIVFVVMLVVWGIVTLIKTSIFG